MYDSTSKAARLRVKTAARLLAEHYRAEGETHPVPCACVGLKCNQLNCSTWWEFFLVNTTKNDFVTLLQLKEEVIQLAEGLK